MFIEQEQVYSVYILSRVVEELFEFASKNAPLECVAVLLGWRHSYRGQNYTRIVDWATGEALCTRVSAEFTEQGVSQYHSLITERYGESENRPRITGIFHSHPFGHKPELSTIDRLTFFLPPYGAEDNVFVVCDPTSGYFEVYLLKRELLPVNWVEYEPD